MIKVMKTEAEAIGRTGKVRPEFIDRAADFIRTYADRCHHGKEEDILFRALKKKELSLEHARILRELLEEHAYARQVVGDLIAAQERYVKGDKTTVDEVARLMDMLVELYPKHIEKEDKHFFIPCMAYFTKEEQENMLAESYEFDRKIIHEKYGKVVRQLEERR